MAQMTSQAGSPEELGYVRCPSGILAILDGGCASMWSHNRQPLLPEHPKIIGATDRDRDLMITGPDALEAGKTLGQSSNPIFLYDQSPEKAEALHAQLAGITSEYNLKADITVLPDRVPHRQRVDRMLDVVGPAGMVEFHGLLAAIISGLPSDRLLLVRGERMPDGPDKGRWRRVWIEMREGDIASSRTIGDVRVDEARLMAIDVDVLGDWDDRKSQDGKADVVFWGRDATIVAADTGAESLDYITGAKIFGWLDLPLKEGLEQAIRIYNMRSDERRFAVDFRPHTHHWQVMGEVRKTPTESGVLQLAGSPLTMFMTTWGDGAFPVEADYDRDGNILRVRLELGCDNSVALQRKLEARWSGHQQ